MEASVAATAAPSATHDAATVTDTPKPRPRDAIVFIPAIGEATLEETVDDLAWRVAAELDRDAPDVSLRHTVQVDPHPEPYSYQALRPSRFTPVRTILREDLRTPSAKPVEVVDVYALDYNKNLTRRYEGLNLFHQSIIVLFTLASMIPRLLHVWVPLGKDFRKHRRGMTWKQKAQISYALIILFLLAVYLAILMVTALVQFQTR